MPLRAGGSAAASAAAPKKELTSCASSGSQTLSSSCKGSESREGSGALTLGYSYSTLLPSTYVYVAADDVSMLWSKCAIRWLGLVNGKV